MTEKKKKTCYISQLQSRVSPNKLKILHIENMAYLLSMGLLKEEQLGSQIN